jgi:hypothetical protein
MVGVLRERYKENSLSKEDREIKKEAETDFCLGKTKENL